MNRLTNFYGRTNKKEEKKGFPINHLPLPFGVLPRPLPEGLPVELG